MRQPFLLFALLFSTGCATVINGRYQSLQVDSYPSGARIDVDCGEVARAAGSTPGKVTLQRGAKHCVLILSKDGYESQQIELRRERSRAAEANKVMAVPVALVSAVVAAMAGEAILNDDGALAAGGFEAGMEAGAAPGRQFDKHTGAAYKWVPGDLFVTLVRERGRAAASPQ
jgi:hypothetical protein